MGDTRSIYSLPYDDTIWPTARGAATDVHADNISERAAAYGYGMPQHSDLIPGLYDTSGEIFGGTAASAKIQPTIKGLAARRSTASPAALALTPHRHFSDV